MANFKLGMDAKAYFGTAGETNPASMTELSNVRDVTINHETGEADITTRANSGWRGTAATLRDSTAEFEMVWKDGDAGFAAIKNAWLTNAPIALAFLTDAHGVAGAEGPVGDYTITNFSRQEPLEEAIIVSVTAKLATFGQWYEA